MTSEQEKLVLAICASLARDDCVTGEWPNQKCQHCGGRSEGYYDSQSFDHDAECLHLLADDLREELRREEQARWSGNA
jgi:hypothetical protein